MVKADFDKLDKALSSTPVSFPRPDGWTCQSWLGQAFKNLEEEGLTKGGEALVSVFGGISSFS